MTNYYDLVKANPALFRHFSCRELLFLLIECPPDFVRAEHWNEHHCFLYVLTGDHIFFSRERSWQVSKGATVFIKKGGLGIQKVDDEPFCALMFYVPDQFLRSFMKEKAGRFPNTDTAISQDMLLPIGTSEVLAAFFQSVFSYFTADQQPPEELIELKFRELLLNIIMDPANREFTGFLQRHYLQSSDDLPEIMERNYLYKLSLEDFARLTHRSLSSFKRDFNRLFGKTPGRWLLEKRLEYARCLLQNSRKPVTEVVMESGFTNLAHFDRIFKRLTGKSPLQYRKQAAGELALH